jgi:hypothetical protein
MTTSPYPSFSSLGELVRQQVGSGVGLLVLRHLPFLVVLALFTIGAVIHLLNFGAFEGSDELIHYNYVQLLATDGRLPDRTTYLTNSTRQASGQPPFAYWVSSVYMRLLNLPMMDGLALHDYIENVARNRWYFPHEPHQRGDNQNVYYHGRAETGFGIPEIVAANRALRLLSVMWGALAVIGAYGAGSEVLPRRWALYTAVLFAFTPTMLHISTYVTNDTPAVALSTLSIWGTLRLLRCGARPVLLITIGLAAGAAALTKINALAVMPGVGLALIVDVIRHRRGIRGFAVNGMLVGVPWLLVFAPWVAYGWLAYNDPLGLNTHRHVQAGWYYATPRSLAEIAQYIPHFYRSYWGQFGTVQFEPLTYAALSVIPVLAGGGYLLILRKRTAWKYEHLAHAAVLGAILLAALLAMTRWMQQLNFTGGRLIYPVHVVVVITLVGGLYAIVRRFRILDSFLQIGTATLVGVCGLVLPLLPLHSTYQPPPMETRTDFQGEPIDFGGTIRLLGHRMENQRITGGWHAVTLCWQVLQPTTRPAAYSVKFMRDGAIVADRTTVFGLGRYPSASWQAGDQFCDRVAVLIDDPDDPDDLQPERATVYDVVVVVLDALTLASDWQPARPDGTVVDVPIIGRVISAAGDMRGDTADESPAIAFPNFAALSAVELSGEVVRGNHAELDLLWQVNGETPDSWSQFVHLVGQDGNAVVLADGEPRGGAYPTWAWGFGEWVADQWTLVIPDDIPPGQYILNTGFYRKDTGERMPVTQANEAVSDGAVVLMWVNIE